MLPPETEPWEPARLPGGQGVRPLERRVRKLADAGCSDIEIARRFRRSAPGIARVRALADLHIFSSRPAVRAGSLRPIERRVVRWADAGHVLCCGTCLDARGIQDAMLMEGAQRSTMDVLADNTLDADKVLVF